MGNRAAALHLPPARVLIRDLAADNPPAETVPALVEPTAAEPEPLRNPRNYRITDADQLGLGSLRKKCRANFAAIELLKQLEAEGRPATDAEKRVLVRYVGWGGLPQVFDEWNDPWQEERQRLQALLTEDEFDSARASTLPPFSEPRPPSQPKSRPRQRP